MNEHDAPQDFLDRIDRTSVALCNRVALVAVAGMLAISVLTVFDVLGRWLINRPIPGFFEVGQILMGVIIVASFPSAIAGRNNLLVDFLARIFGARTQLWLAAAGAWMMLVFLGLLAWRIGFYASEIAGRNGATFTLNLPLAPFWWLVAMLLVFCTAVQMLVALVDLRRAFRATPEHGSLMSAPGAVLLALLTISVALCIFLLFAAGSKQGLFAGIAPSTPGAIAAFAFAAVFALTLLQVPLAAALGLMGLIAMPTVMGNFQSGLLMFGGNTAELLINLDLSTIPLWIMMGGFAAAANMSSEMYRAAYALFGHLRGGLAYATIAACAGFGGPSGSSVATAATIGKVALPEMRKRGYSVGLATGSIAAGGTLGMLIPPSTMMVIYAGLTGTSIGALYIAAIVPSVVATLFYMGVVWAVTRADPAAAPLGPRADRNEIISAVLGSWSSVLLFAVVLGGLYAGIFTSTEAAAVGAGMAFAFALVRQRRSGRRWVLETLGETAASTAQIYLLVIGAVMFSSYIGVTQIADAIVLWLKSFYIAPIAVVMMVLLIYMLLGTFMDSITMMLVTIPMVIPLMKDLGYDLVWWGIMMVMKCEIAMIIPPLGLNVFVIKAIAGPSVPVRTIYAGVLPFVGADLIRLVVLAAFPIITLWLPATMK